MNVNILTHIKSLVLNTGVSFRRLFMKSASKQTNCVINKVTAKNSMCQ